MDDQRSMISRPPPRRGPRTFRAAGFAIALAVAALLVFWLRGEASPPEPAFSMREPESARVEPLPATASPVLPASTDSRQAPPKREAVDLAWNETAKVDAAHAHEEVIAGPRDENLVPGAKPHPITTEHLRRYRQVDLVEGTWAALEARDFAKARELIEQHRLAYKDEYGDLDEGMSLLADCMEYPSPATRARAQRFYDEETYSTARRRIRRWCLER